MKKTLSLVLTLSFILCAAVTFTVSAAETTLNAANKGWNVNRGGGFLYSDDNGEFYWKTNASGETYDWPAVYSGSLEEGVITATVSAAGNVGIFFGGEGVSANVKDGGSNLVGAANTRFSWIVLEVDPTSKVARLRFYYDDDTQSGVSLGDNSQSNIPLNDTPANAEKYGIDGTSDVELKVEFTKAGKMIAYVNGVQTITRNEGFPTFGTECGMIVRGANYGSANASSEVGRVKSFSKSSNISAFNKWTVRRGSSSWAAADGGEFLWKYVADGTNGRTWNNLIQYYKDLEEGTVTATVAKNSRIGIAFAGTGFENVNDNGSAGALSAAQNLQYYWAVVDWDGTANKYYLALKVDSSATAGGWTEIQRVNLSSNSLISDNDYTITVDFTKAGDISVSFNGEKLISVTDQTIYGDQLGMVTTSRGPLANMAGQVAGTVKGFVINTPAKETGDATTVYLVLSAVILCATFTVACVSRKKRIAE